MKIKEIILGLVLIVASMNVMGDELQLVCKEVSTTSKLIMEHRQNGTAMSVIMEVFSKEDNQIIKELFENIVLKAYEIPRFNTVKMKQKTIDDFRDEVYLSCTKSIRERR